MLSTKNKKIIQFYETHEQLDFEKVNIAVIDLLENILREKTINNTENLFSYIQSMEESISSLNDQFKMSNQQMVNMQTSISEIPSQMNNTISSKLYSIRDEYIKEIEKTLHLHNNSQQTSLQDLMDKQLTEQLKSILENNTNDTIIKRIENVDASIKKDFQETLSSFQKGNTDNSIVETLQHNFQTKFDSLQQFILTSHNQIKENDASNRESLLCIQNHFDRQKNSSFKGIDSENRVEMLLNESFPDACVENKTGEAKSGDFLLTRVDKVPIMIENKDYSKNVPVQEVEKFIRDIEYNNYCGIFISQNSGISRKPNFHIDIHNNVILIYIHHLDYDFDKVKLAVHTIDQLSKYICELGYDNEDIKIPHDTLREINNEYQHFYYQRDELKSILKKFQKDMTRQIGQLELNSLSTILSKHFATTDATLYKCPHCTKQFKNAKALAAHTKKCKDKESNVNSITSFENKKVSSPSKQQTILEVITQ
jgi:hypothetical protein